MVQRCKEEQEAPQSLNLSSLYPRRVLQACDECDIHHACGWASGTARLSPLPWLSGTATGVGQWQQCRQDLGLY